MLGTRTLFKGLKGFALVVAVFVTSVFVAKPQATTVAAASCSRTDVNAVINGPTHTAVDGDTIQIPSGSCTWTSGIIVPDDVGITIIGSGTPTSAAGTVGPDASCTATEITVNGATAFRASPTYGNSTMRFSCLEMVYTASSASIGISVLGACTASGCPNLRVDNVTFTSWGGHASAGISYAVNVFADVFGVADHNSLTGNGTDYLHFAQLHHAHYMGVGEYGDNAWALAEDYGTSKFFFFENNLFTDSGTTENEGAPVGGGVADEGGCRVIVRNNTFASMNSIQVGVAWHGTESGGRYRGCRAFEVYRNTVTFTANGTDLVGIRSGTGHVWGNTLNHPSGVLNALVVLATMRTEADIGGWGACDGSSVWDTNDGTTYYSGTVSSVATNVITVSPSPGWTVNQWAPAGAPYSVRDTTKSNGSEIASNTADTITLKYSGVPGNWLPDAGDSFQILRASACLDQAAGRGAGTYYSGVSPSPSSAANQALSPMYLWDNTINNGAPTDMVFSYTGRVVRNDEYYHEDLNQAAQTSSSAPFDGTTSKGIGHGIIARRPATCTTNTAFWATDEGEWDSSNGATADGRLYVCTSTDTWTLSYTPYTYPHPLVNGGGSTRRSRLRFRVEASPSQPFVLALAGLRPR